MLFMGVLTSKGEACVRELGSLLSIQLSDVKAPEVGLPDSGDSLNDSVLLSKPVVLPRFDCCNEHICVHEFSDALPFPPCSSFSPANLSMLVVVVVVVL